MTIMLNKETTWINSFDPKKRIFVGPSYFFLKRVMDLTIVFLAMPLWGLFFWRSP